MVAAELQSNLIAFLNREDDLAPNLGTIMMIELRQSIAITPFDLNALWQLYNLPMAYLPRPRTARDAYRKAAPRNRPRNGLTLIEYKGEARNPYGLDLACVLTSSTDAKRKIAVVHRNRAVVGLDEQGDLVVIDPPNGLTDREAEWIAAIRKEFEDA